MIRRTSTRGLAGLCLGIALMLAGAVPSEAASLSAAPARKTVARESASSLWTEARVWLSEVWGGKVKPQGLSAVWAAAGWAIDPNGGDTNSVCPGDNPLGCLDPRG
jgi:hypothetical protein